MLCLVGARFCVWIALIFRLCWARDAQPFPQTLTFFSFHILVMRKYVRFLDGGKFSSSAEIRMSIVCVCFSEAGCYTAHINLPQHALSRAKLNPKHIASKHTNFEAIEDCLAWRFPIIPSEIHFHRWNCIHSSTDIVFYEQRRGADEICNFQKENL